MEFVKSLYKLQKSHPNWYYHSVNTDQDHVHLIIELPPTVSLAYCIQQLKSHTSADLQRRFPFINKMSDEGSVWSVGYFVSTIGLNEDQIRKYVERQGLKDKGTDITSEFS